MKTYNFSDFMQGTHEKHKPPLIPLVVLPFFNASTVLAEGEPTIQEKMMNAFTPLIDLIQGMAYPVALSVILGGALFVIIGNKERGLDMISKAAGGYMLITVLPMIFDVLVDAMKGAIAP